MLPFAWAISSHQLYPYALCVHTRHRPKSHLRNIPDGDCFSMFRTVADQMLSVRCSEPSEGSKKCELKCCWNDSLSWANHGWSSFFKLQTLTILPPSEFVCLCAGMRISDRDQPLPSLAVGWVVFPLYMATFAVGATSLNFTVSSTPFTNHHYRHMYANITPPPWCHPLLPAQVHPINDLCASPRPQGPHHPRRQQVHLQRKLGPQILLVTQGKQSP